MSDNPYMMLAKFILPKEMTEFFDLIRVHADEYGGEQRLHLYLDEKEVVPEGYADAKPPQASDGLHRQLCRLHSLSIWQRCEKRVKVLHDKTNSS